MADQNYTPYGAATGANCFKEAVCINAGRIYDSCSDKDCLEDLRVYFTDVTQPVIDNAQSIKVRKVEILNVVMDVECVPFNKGFYSVDMTFYFLITLDTYQTQVCGTPTTVQGLSAFNKKVILYGSEGSVKDFSSVDSCKFLNGEDCSIPSNCPTARVQVVDPIVLASKVCECQKPDCDCCGTATAIPENMNCVFNGTFVTGDAGRYVYVSIGMFSIVQLEREVQMMIPVYDYSIPDKECTASDAACDPCELFRKIKFPVNEFFPPRLAELDCDDNPTT